MADSNLKPLTPRTGGRSVLKEGAHGRYDHASIFVLWQKIRIFENTADVAII